MPERLLRRFAIIAVAAFLAPRARAVDDAVLAEELDVSLFAGRVTRCPAPFVASESTCTCGAGWTRTQAGRCEPCAAGFFNTEAGGAPCSKCPAHMTSFEGAQDESECMCAAGYFAVDGACEPCAAGTYKAFIGNASCVACVQHASTGGAAATSSAACVCDGGLGMVDGVCVPCPAQQYGRGGVCAPCPAHSASAAGAAECACAAGYARQDSGECTECAAGWHATGDVCAPCPAHMYSSQAATACSCVAGFRRRNATTCEPCAAHYYCAGRDLEAACPEYSSSAPGSRARTDCVCDAGYFAYDGACLLCREGFYCDDGVRHACPVNTTSAAGSFDVLNCTCAQGFASVNM